MVDSRFPSGSGAAYSNYHRTVKRRQKRRLSFFLLIAMVSLVTTNVVLASFYSDRAYPRTKVLGVNVGNKTQGQIDSTLSELGVFSYAITLLAPQNVSLKLSASEYGLREKDVVLQTTPTSKRINIPIIDIFRSYTLAPPIEINNAILDTRKTAMEQMFKREPVNAKLTISAEGFKIEDEVVGYTLKYDQLSSTIIQNLTNGKTQFEAPINTKQATKTTEQIRAEKNKLQKQFDVAVKLTHNDKSITATAADKATWFIEDSGSYTISQTAIATFVKQFGLANGFRANQPADTASQIAKSLQNNTAFEAAVTTQPYLKTYTYCVASRGVNSTELASLRAKLASTYADKRGWSLSGDVNFVYGTSGCDYTVWLSTADQMTSFGGVCDAYWSCRINDNVVINFERWSNASDAWNDANGSLEDYRYMVINHETGHRLGFGHRYCSQRGALAPVMQQQSIDLQGCKFSPWPSYDELKAFRAKLEA